MPVRLCYIVLNMKTTPTRQRIHTNMRAVPRLHCTGRKGRPEWVFRSVMKTPINSLRNDSFRINFTLVIMWQPVWTRSCTKLIRISCKRPLKVFVPRASLVAWKTNKKKKNTATTISVAFVQPFCFSAFRPYFCAVVQCNTVGNFAYSLAQIWLKWRSSGLIKRYILRQWMKRGGTVKINQSVLHDVDL